MAVVDGRVVGFVLVVDDEVEQVYLSADQRGTDLADQLLAEAERQVASGGHRLAWLAVVAGNARARAFYQRRGWSDDGPFDHQAATDVPGATVGVPSHRYTNVVTLPDLDRRSSAPGR